MTADVWQPLKARLAGRQGLREGVPSAMVKPLRDWIWNQALMYGANVIPRVRIRLDLPENGDSERADHDWLAHDTKKEDLLSITDAVLNLMPSTAEVHEMTVGRIRIFNTQLLTAEVREAWTRKQQLRQLLGDARSVYTIKADGSGLERRVHPIADRMLGAAVRATAAKPDAGSAAVQLRKASDAVRALQPNAPLAYSLAIKAVESAAHAVIEPSNKKATLGTMLGILDGSPAAFEVEIAGKDRGKGSVTPVTRMMRMLWEGQTSRHGSKEPTRDETREEAEMAVQLASVLVLWFSDGMVRRR